MRAAEGTALAGVIAGQLDRIEALVFLRRSGMMIGPAWSADRLLAPAKNKEIPE